MGRGEVRLTGKVRIALSRGMLVAGIALLVAYLGGCGQAAPPGATGSGLSGQRRSSAPTADRYDLGRDEGRGGHTLGKHVGRSDAELRERLEKERNISAASTWTDRLTAEETVARALRAAGEKVESWKRHGYPRTNLALHFDAGRVIGRSLRQGESEAVPCSSAVIVLRADGPDSFYVLTSFPEAHE
jgi:hypothetical protein